MLSRCQSIMADHGKSTPTRQYKQQKHGFSSSHKRDIIAELLGPPRIGVHGVQVLDLVQPLFEENQYENRRNVKCNLP